MFVESIKLILISTATQIGLVFGLFFGLGFLHSVIYKYTTRYFSRIFGWTGIIVTGIIGTPIHELSHYLMAKIFRHRVHSVNLFHPERDTGKMGHVEHSYDTRSIYQKIGNFFIGSSPIIFGSGALVLLLYIFTPDPSLIIKPIMHIPHSVSDFTHAWGASFIHAWNQIDLQSWKFWVFLYLSISIALHMAPSSYDQKTMWRGFFLISILMLVINIILTIAKIDFTGFLMKHIELLYAFAWVLVYAIVVSFVFFVPVFLLYLLSRIFVRR